MTSADDDSRALSCAVIIFPAELNALAKGLSYSLIKVNIPSRALEMATPSPVVASSEGEQDRSPEYGWKGRVGHACRKILILLSTAFVRKPIDEEERNDSTHLIEDQIVLTTTADTEETALPALHERLPSTEDDVEIVLDADSTGPQLDAHQNQASIPGVVYVLPFDPEIYRSIPQKLENRRTARFFSKIRSSFKKKAD